MSRSLTLDLSSLKIQPTSHTTDLQKTNFSFSLGTLCKKVAAVRRATNYKQRTPMMNGWAD